MIEPMLGVDKVSIEVDLKGYRIMPSDFMDLMQSFLDQHGFMLTEITPHYERICSGCKAPWGVVGSILQDKVICASCLEETNRRFLNE